MKTAISVLCTVKVITEAFIQIQIINFDVLAPSISVIFGFIFLKTKCIYGQMTEVLTPRDHWDKRRIRKYGITDAEKRIKRGKRKQKSPIRNSQKVSRHFVERGTFESLLLTSSYNEQKSTAGAGQTKVGWCCPPDSDIFQRCKNV